MGHEIEFVDGKACMAYAKSGGIPWHNLGEGTSDDLTSFQMMEKAGCDWTVEKVPAFVTIDNKKVAIDRSALVRSSDNRILDIVSNDWNPVQNDIAFDFFNEFVMAGDMTMETAGSLKDGQIVFGLAKIKNSFEAFKGDRVDAYLHFTNFHKYGFSTDVRFTPIRVVCNNTLTLSLNTAVERMAKISHRRIFDPAAVKDMLGIATDKMAKYQEIAQFLGSKPAANEDIVEYFTRIFPVTGSNPKKEISKNAQLAYEILETQPGAEFGEGSWWQSFNAVTYLTDHLAGRNADSRMTSAWYGVNKNLKVKALDLAMEYAEAS